MVKVITYGSFDLFHEGHYRLLKRAKALGDYLIVGVTTEHYDESRGKLNLMDPIMTRIENVRATGFADEIIVEDHDGQKIDDIQRYNVDIFTVGSDWKGYFDYLNAYCKVIYLERTPNVSSTLRRNSLIRITKIGIIGTGRIAPRFLDESKYVSSVVVSCAYNPDKADGRRFQDRFQIRVYSDSFVEFLEQVDAVYVASPNETHAGYVWKALEAGKHVLCEKPMTFTCNETRELYDYANSKGKVLMEGIRTAYLPGFQQLINVARSGVIGEIRDVEACFSRLADPSSREMTDAKYGGAFLEYGSYSLLPVFKLLGIHYQDVRIDFITSASGIDAYTKILLRYETALGSSKSGAGVKSEGQLIVAGTNGYILAQSPWWLTRAFDVRYEDPNRIDHYESNFKGDGFRYEINEFAGKINGYGGASYKLTPEESIAMADIVERFMKKRGIL